MTNEELFARQLHNINQAIYGIAVVIRGQLAELPIPMGTVELIQHPTVTEFDRVMQSYTDTLTSLTSLVQKANSGAGIILPN